MGPVPLGLLLPRLRANRPITNETHDGGLKARPQYLQLTAAAAAAGLLPPDRALRVPNPATATLDPCVLRPNERAKDSIDAPQAF